MAQQAAGLLMYRKSKSEVQFFLIHPGGPYWMNKNEGSWSIPKGLVELDQDLLTTAQREFKEETGIEPCLPFKPLGSVKLKSGKVIHAWLFEGEWNAEDGITSNYIDIEWPPRSKKIISIPEVDRAEWMNVEMASKRINLGQVPFLERSMKIIC